MSEADPSSTMARWAREPLVRFVVVGAAIFAIDRALVAREAPADDAHRIVISDAYVEGLRARHRDRIGRDPSEDEEAALIRDFVREEALYREAARAGLDVGDAIVRRRMVQKIEMLLAGTVDVPEPDDDALGAWVAQHADELQRPARTTLEHVFFATDRRRDATRGDAEAALATLEQDPERAHPEALGDPFLRGHTLGPSTDAQLEGAMGPRFLEQVASVEPGQWAVIESTFGMHVVRVVSREAARAPALSEVRERARAAWLEEQRAAAVEREIARIVLGYEVARTSEETP